MAQVTETRESGLEILEQDVEPTVPEEDVERTELVRLPDETTFSLGEAAGNPITVSTQYLIVESVHMQFDEDSMEAQMLGVEEVDAAGGYITNEDGELGEEPLGVVSVEEGGFEDLIEKIEEEHL